MEAINASIYPSPLGEMAILSNGAAITGLYFLGQRHFDASILDSYNENEDEIIEKTKHWLDAYFSGKIPNEIPDISIDGCSIFKHSVLEELMKIKYGETSTYKEIAKRVETKTGKKVSYRAIGNAIAHNPISILIPCHRIKKSDGSLGGYAGGIEKKKALLDLEKEHIIP